MYLVNKGFANSQISASKGKVIDIKDKSLATALESAGFVTPYSEKAMSNKEMEKTFSNSDYDKSTTGINRSSALPSSMDVC